MTVCNNIRVNTRKKEDGMTFFTIIGILAVIVALFYLPRTIAVALLGVLLVSVMGFNAFVVTFIFIFVIILAFICDMATESYEL